MHKAVVTTINTNLRLQDFDLQCIFFQTSCSMKFVKQATPETTERVEQMQFPKKETMPSSQTVRSHKAVGEMWKQWDDFDIFANFRKLADTFKHR